MRRVHRALGVVFTVNFLAILVTGLLVEHREWFGLEAQTISRRWLPSAYRPQDPDTEIRADIVVTDLHSGRLFGPPGVWVVDATVAAWLLLMGTGYGIRVVSRRSK